MTSKVKKRYIRIKCYDNEKTYEWIPSEVEYSQLENLAKDAGKMCMADFIFDCIDNITKSHYPDPG